MVDYLGDIGRAHPASTALDAKIGLMTAPPPQAPLSGGPRVRSTWDDVESPHRGTVWQHLRALRHAPPGHAHSGDRRKTFGSALEQAEQLFEAAATVGYAARPILLFYGLSQAGRAVAAAAKSATSPPADWRLRGHGIEVSNLDQRPAGLHQLLVRDCGRGSFVQLGGLLRSGTLPTGASLGQLWATIPDLRTTPVDAGTEYLAPLTLSGWRTRGGQIISTVCGLPWRFTDPYTEVEIVSYLASYPTLVGSQNANPDHVYPQETTRTADVPRAWPLPAGQDPDAFIASRTWPYRGDDERRVFPALGGSLVPLHPLLAWWAMLYTLSMLARYEPASWEARLNVDAEPDAVPIEAALSRALDTCPQLILHAIRAVST
jgi:hypothetical protein